MCKEKMKQNQLCITSPKQWVDKKKTKQEKNSYKYYCKQTYKQTNKKINIKYPKESTSFDTLREICSRYTRDADSRRRQTEKVKDRIELLCLLFPSLSFLLLFSSGGL